MTTTIKLKRVSRGVYEFKWNGTYWFLQYIDNQWCVSSGSVSHGGFRQKQAALEFVCGKQEER